jgi:hypothetical protein
MRSTLSVNALYNFCDSTYDKWVLHKMESDFRFTVIGTPVSYSGGTGFHASTVDCLTSLRSFMDYLCYLYASARILS